MDLQAKIRTLPTRPGVYLYKNAEGEVIYVGKAKSLRARVRNYFVEAAQEDAKTGSLMREAVDIEYIVVDNEKEALALENNLIKQKKPRFNILLRDDKTYPYVKLTLGERFPRVYVTRRLKKDGSAYYGPYFPAGLAYRIADLIHRHFLIPSCKIDLRRFHPRAERGQHRGEQPADRAVLLRSVALDGDPIHHREAGVGLELGPHVRHEGGAGPQREGGGREALDRAGPGAQRGDHRVQLRHAPRRHRDGPAPGGDARARPGLRALDLVRRKEFRELVQAHRRPPGLELRASIARESEGDGAARSTTAPTSGSSTTT